MITHLRKSNTNNVINYLTLAMKAQNVSEDYLDKKKTYKQYLEYYLLNTIYKLMKSQYQMIDIYTYLLNL